MLMYVITVDELSEFEEFLEKVVQFGWLDTSTSSFPSLFFKLGSEHIKELKEICVSKIVLMIKLFLQMFWEKTWFLKSWLVAIYD